MRSLLGTFICFSIWSLFAPKIALAQLNESDTLKTKADLVLTAFNQSGNVDVYIFRVQSEVSLKPVAGMVFKTRNSYVYQEFGNVKADEDILSLNFLYLHPERKVYPLVLGFMSTNYRRAIKLRSLVGGGLTFQVLQKSDNWLKLSLTTEHEYTEFRRTDFNRSQYDGSSTISTLRGTVWMNGRHEFLNKKVIFRHESYFQPSLLKADNYRGQVDIGLEFPVSKRLSLRAGRLHTFERIVIQGQSQSDKILTFGVTIKNY
jgi:hypothetical protein